MNEPLDRIRIDPKLMVGKPVIRGTRIPVELVVRMLAHDEIDPAELDEIISSYKPLYENKGVFLIPYAGLKARKNECGEALASYRKALEIERESWKDILREIETREWPEEEIWQSALLEIDCLIAGERRDEAFERLQRLDSLNVDRTGDLLSRLDTLVELNPRREYFTVGASWLAGNGDITGAEKLLKRGTELLGEEESTALGVELIGLLHDAGMFEEAAPILQELISSSGDKNFIFKNMERSYARRALRDIERLASSAERDPEEIERRIVLCIDCGRTKEAREALLGSDLPLEKRICLLSEIYLAEERPASVLALVKSGGGSIDPKTDEGARTLYAAGIAGEMLGEHGAAHAAFSRILASGRAYRDSGDRARRNHTQFIESSLREKVLVLEAVRSLEGLHGGEDTT